MSWLTGKPKTPRVPVDHRACKGSGQLPRFGLAPGGQVVLVGWDPCPGCNGRGKV